MWRCWLGEQWWWMAFQFSGHAKHLVICRHFLKTILTLILLLSGGRNCDYWWFSEICISKLWNWNAQGEWIIISHQLVMFSKSQCEYIWINSNHIATTIPKTLANHIFFRIFMHLGKKLVKIKVAWTKVACNGSNVWWEVLRQQSTSTQNHNIQNSILPCLFFYICHIVTLKKEYMLLFQIQVALVHFMGFWIWMRKYLVSLFVLFSATLISPLIIKTTIKFSNALLKMTMQIASNYSTLCLARLGRVSFKSLEPLHLDNYHLVLFLRGGHSALWVCNCEVLLDSSLPVQV